MSQSDAAELYGTLIIRTWEQVEASETWAAWIEKGVA